MRRTLTVQPHGLRRPSSSPGQRRQGQHSRSASATPEPVIDQAQDSEAKSWTLEKNGMRLIPNGPLASIRVQTILSSYHPCLDVFENAPRPLMYVTTPPDKVRTYMGSLNRHPLDYEDPWGYRAVFWQYQGRSGTEPGWQLVQAMPDNAMPGVPYLTFSPGRMTVQSFVAEADGFHQQLKREYYVVKLEYPQPGSRDFKARFARIYFWPNNHPVPPQMLEWFRT